MVLSSTIKKQFIFIIHDKLNKVVISAPSFMKGDLSVSLKFIGDLAIHLSVRVEAT